MFPSKKTRQGRRFIIGPMVLSLLFVAVLGANFAKSAVEAPPATAATYTTAVKGYGKWFPAGACRTYGGHVGEQVIVGKMRGFCMEMNKSTPNTDVVGNISDLPGVTGETQRQVINIANEAYYGKIFYANGTTVDWAKANLDQRNKWAYRIQFAIWGKMSPCGLSYYNNMVSRGYLNSADVTEIRGIWARAAAHGLKSVTLTSQTPYVGQTGTATVNARSSLGYYVPRGMKVVSAARTPNVKIVSTSGVAGTTGYIQAYSKTTFKFIRTNVNTVGLGATVTVPSDTVTKVTFPSASWRQRLIGSNYTISKSAVFNYNSVVGAPTIKSACSPDCDGTSTTNVQGCAPAGAKPMKWEVTNRNTGLSLGYVDDAPGGVCTAKNFATLDNFNVVTRHCFTSVTGGPCVTPWVNDPGVHNVKCPAWEKATIYVGANCTWCTAGVAWDTPFSSRVYVGNTVVGNSAGDLLAKSSVLTGGTKQNVDLTDLVQVGSTIAAKFSVYEGKDASGKPVGPIFVDKMLVKIQVLALGTSSATLSVTEYDLNGAAAKSTVKTVAATKGMFSLAM